MSLEVPMPMYPPASCHERASWWRRRAAAATRPETREAYERIALSYEHLAAAAFGFMARYPGVFTTPN